CARGAGGYW
nr:immunoglobulin heavy chain junction region [Mus musculus]NSM04208.1 immunoglobulin heavy chain junction region [Mus musculus]NSM04489.1 immunoglobulin heavy chain junction region [Mus musculus]NSM04618.1 immunoglobulin heavy chain junction region [Mus musculus]NSM04918.1 immunoglobulin heavy chain junction region [Mus musculus]